MKKILVFCTWLSLGLHSTAQKIRIVDIENNRPIPFATISILGEKRSVNVDDEGFFDFSGTIYDTDTLMISMQNYLPFKLQVASLQSNELVRLPRKKNALNKFDSTGGNMVEVNKFDNNKVFFYTGLEKNTERFNYLQIAQKFENKYDNSSLNQILIKRLILKNNGYVQDARLISKTKFKLRIYDINPITGGPGNDLCTEVIEISNNKDELLNINLQKYKILIPSNFFFVGIEWLRLDYNEQFSLVRYLTTKLGSTTSKTSMKVYQPFVGMSNLQNEQNNCWALSYDNMWIQYTHFKTISTNFAISAVIELPK